MDYKVAYIIYIVTKYDNSSSINKHYWVKKSLQLYVNYDNKTLRKRIFKLDIMQ